MWFSTRRTVAWQQTHFAASPVTSFGRIITISTGLPSLTLVAHSRKIPDLLRLRASAGISPDSVCTLAGTFTALRGALLFSGCGETMADLLKNARVSKLPQDTTL
jgi:hypothetical protein